MSADLRPDSLHLPTLLAAFAICAVGPLSGQQLSEPQSEFAADATLDVTSRYVFRGYEMDDRGTFLQPSLAVGYTLFSQPSGTLRTVSASASAWSSLHAGTRAYPGDLGWFEVDLGVSVSTAFSNGWTTALVYTSYLAPDGAFEQIHELGLALQLPLIDVEGLTLSPHALIAQELHHGRGDEDTYLEVGTGIELLATGALQWTLPITVGMSVNGFYEDESGNNQWFGFFGSGLEATTDLAALGLTRLPGRLIGAVDLTVVNRDAALSHDPLNDVRWTARAGLAFGF